MMEYENWRTLLKNERLPTALVDLDAFDRNIDRIARIVQGSSLSVRLATKSIRVPELIQRILRRGAPFQGLMCFSAEEALFLAEQGFDDLLLAYPTVQRSDLSCLRELHESGKKISAVFDASEGIDLLAQAMSGITRPFPVLPEVDMSLRLLGGLIHLGVRRSPIRSLADLDRVLDSIRKYPQLQFAGLMAYEAQVAGLGDQNPFKKLLNPLAAIVRKLSVRSVNRRRKQIDQHLKSRGIKYYLFNGGGTGSLSYAVQETSLTELTAGSAFYCPHLFDYYSNLELEPACFFALQVVRSSDPGYVTCQGGGYIASGEPGWDKVPKPFLPDGLELVSTEGCGEVQTPLKMKPDTRLGAGSPVLFRHAKAGELMERFESVTLISAGKAVGKAKTYRGFGRNFF
jgi:D-serine deaminase-like pyridoxal phosphate-dependent protein